MVEGIQAVQARIHAIQALVAPRPAPSTAGVAAPRSAPGSFEAALATAVEENHAGSGHSHTHATERSGRTSAPPELAAYGNGRIPPGALEAIGVGNHRLYGPAARAFREMKAAAEADGVRIGVTDSYRSYESQVDLARRKGLYSQGGLAATPGTSNHGWGLSLDLDLDPAAQTWMRANAGRFGFAEDVPREPWHWTYQRRS